MAVCSSQILNHHRNAILRREIGGNDDFVDMSTYNPSHSLNPKPPNARDPSDHSASVSPPSFDPPTLAEFGDDDEIEDESFESIGKFHDRFHARASKDDPQHKSMSAVQANKMKISTAERRATHNAIERARRESLNGRFLELARALPTMSNVKRPSKSAIVNKSLEFICESQMREYNLIRDNNYLRAQVNELRAQLRLSPLPPASFATPLHLQQQRPMPPRAPHLVHHPLSLPVGGPTLPPPSRPIDDSLAQINMPLSADAAGFSMTNTTKDTFAHPHDQAAGPFVTHHYQPPRTQSFAVNGFGLLGATDVFGAPNQSRRPIVHSEPGATDLISLQTPEEKDPDYSSPPNLTKAFYSSDEEGSGASPPNVQNPFISDSLDPYATTEISPNPSQLTESIIDLMQAQSNAHALPELIGGANGSNWLKSDSAGFGSGLASTYLF